MTASTKEWIVRERRDSRTCEEWPWTIARCCIASSSEGLITWEDTVAQNDEAPEGLSVDAWRNCIAQRRRSDDS